MKLPRGSQNASRPGKTSIIRGQLVLQSYTTPALGLKPNCENRTDASSVFETRLWPKTAGDPVEVCTAHKKTMHHTGNREATDDESESVDGVGRTSFTGHIVVSAKAKYEFANVPVGMLAAAAM